MRVIAGSLGGRRLTAPSGRETRPTSDRVREAIFSMLADVQGALVLDLFAGSGAMGIEAISRGAAAAVFVERDQRAAAVITANLRELGVTAEVAQVRCRPAEQALRSALAAKEKYDLLIIDPPYRRAQDWEAELSAALPALMRRRGRVVVESDTRRPLVLQAPIERQRRYGDTSITIHRQP